MLSLLTVMAAVGIIINRRLARFGANYLALFNRFACRGGIVIYIWRNTLRCGPTKATQSAAGRDGIEYRSA